MKSKQNAISFQVVKLKELRPDVPQVSMLANEGGTICDLFHDRAYL